jgi:hypothetical protein
MDSPMTPRRRKGCIMYSRSHIIGERQEGSENWTENRTDPAGPRQQKREGVGRSFPRSHTACSGGGGSYRVAVLVAVAVFVPL